MKSFGLLRTNPSLTTNIKIVVDSNYRLSLDSIESDPTLSLDRFKNIHFTKDNYYDDLIPFFYKDISSDVAYKVKFDNDSDTMSNNFSYQYDELYNFGARNISNNKNYSEEFEYFAPLYLDGGIPENFVIFRVDGSGIGNIDAINFRDEVIEKMKVVKVFNLTKSTSIGSWIDKNFLSNRFFIDSPLDIDFRRLEFSRWNGIDFKNGGYVSRSLFMDDIFENELEIFELDKFITETYRNSGVVFSKILNLSFLFNDTPSTPNGKRKWSLNRYYGFYIDNMILVKSISPYKPIKINDDVDIVNNILMTSNKTPFVDIWDNNINNYLEIGGVYYLIERNSEIIKNVLNKKVNHKEDIVINRKIKGRASDSIVRKPNNDNMSFIEDYGDIIIYKYRIISETNINISNSHINTNYSFINNMNRIVNDIQDPFILEHFDDSDVWLIEIDGIYHSLSKDGDYIKLNTDYSFFFNNNKFVYRVNGFDKEVSILLDTTNTQPIKFNIFKINFSDIKDFDTNIVDTEYSRYEYEKLDEITQTDETKMYLEDISSEVNPPNLDDFIYKDKVVNIPVSSEYIVNYELFKINEVDNTKTLSDIWRKNPVYCRWVYKNSLSGSDVPYLLNNSLIFEDFNRTTNVFDPEPKRIERNLDYFYTYLDYSLYDNSSYLYHSLHVLDKFDLSKYLNIGSQSSDYFSTFFGSKINFLDNKVSRNVNKFSIFNHGDDTIPNSTLFRGIKLDIYEINNVKEDNKIIDKLSIRTSNKFNDFKFSILLSATSNLPNYNSENMFTGVNNHNTTLSWNIITEWDINNDYEIGDIILSNGILYKLLFDLSNIDLSPNIMVGDESIRSRPGIEWSFETDNNFWNPIDTYVLNSVVYNNNEFYYCINQYSNIDFWSPIRNYTKNDFVLYLGKYYISLINNNPYSPNESNWLVVDRVDNVKWLNVSIWNPSLYYNIDTPFIVHDNVLYNNINININDDPSKSDNWSKVYSFIPDTNFDYSVSRNNIIHQNNTYYKCISNQNGSTLDNNITIYINELYNNILINININDNTLPEILNNDIRDKLYSNLYSKLTAANFIKAIDDINNKYDYSDEVKYVVIDEFGIKKYDKGNISDLPYIIKCDEPDILDVKIGSFIKTKVHVPINPVNILENGKIINISQINHFNNIPIASTIVENKDDIVIMDVIHGNRNVTKSTIFRYSGCYVPLFYDIQLFKKDVVGNYKFDTNLSSFGIMKERKIRKINRNGSILKLNNFQDEKSIYPMLDEFGYDIYDFFIFSSTWDDGYYLESIPLHTDIKSDDLIRTNLLVPKNIGLIK